MTIRRPMYATAVLVVLVGIAGCTSTGGGSPTNPPVVPSTSNQAAAVAWMERFCGLVNDLKAASTRAVNEASAKYPNDLKQNLATTLGLLGEKLPTVVSRLRDLGPSPVTNADRTVDSLTRELTKAQDSFAQAKKDIDALPGNDQTQLQQIMNPIHPTVGALTTIPLGLIAIPESFREAGDLTPACKRILDHETPPAR